MYYITKTINNLAIVHSAIPDEPYIAVDSLPDGDGILCFDEDGNLIKRNTNQMYQASTDSVVDFLKQQLKAASDQNEFLEDCIAEMAEIVYA